MKNEELTIIYVNYNSSEVLEHSLESLIEQNYKEFKVIIVDNSPGKFEFDKIQAFKKKYSNYFKIEAFKPRFNLGFAGGNNYALRRTKSEYLFLLNCDTELTSSFLENTISYLKDHPKVGMLSPKILCFENRNLIWYAGSFLNPKNLHFTDNIGFNQTDIGKYNDIKETAYASGAALFTRREVIEQIGYMDEILFMYAEETDWNYRAKKVGYKIVYFPKTSLYHYKGSKVTSKRRIFKVYLYTRNQLIFMLKNLKFVDLLFYLCLNYFERLIMELFISFLKKTPKSFYIYIRASFLGLFIGFKRKTNRNCKSVLRKEYLFIQNLLK